MRPTAYIFGMYQCLVVPFINPANHTPGVQIGHPSEVFSSHRLIMGKTFKTFFKAMRLLLTPGAWLAGLTQKNTKHCNIINKPHGFKENDIISYLDAETGRFFIKKILGLRIALNNFFFRSTERHEGFVGGRALLQAVRSYLHFSQLSSWLISTGGALSMRVVYRYIVAYSKSLPAALRCVLEQDTLIPA